MSDRVDPRLHQSPGRKLSPVRERVNAPTRSPMANLRPDARTFKPVRRSTAQPLHGTFEPPPASPVYDLPTSPWIPPSPSVPPTPDAVNLSATLAQTHLSPHALGNALSASQGVPLRSRQFSLQSIWSSSSESAGSHMRSGSELPLPDPALHAHEHSTLSHGCASQQPPYPAETQERIVHGKKGSANEMPTFSPPSLTAPSPPRNLYSTGAVNYQPWSRSPHPFDQRSTTYVHASGSPERIVSRPPQPVIHNNHNTAMSEASGRETPGGVQLPSSDDDVFGSPIRYASPEGLGSNESTTTSPSSPSAAKALAEFIKSGGAEPPSKRGPSMPPPRTPHYRPPMMQYQHEQAPAYYAPGAVAPVPPHPSMQSMTPPTHSPAPPMHMQDGSLVQRWKMQGGPTWSDLLANLPFVERALTIPPMNYGVVRIGDIPFGATKPEIVALFGEKAPMVAMPRESGSYAIHIMMERATAKSNDCYVELASPEAAVTETHRLQAGKRLIGNRRARIQLSNQLELMTEMFPRARDVVWQGCEPQVMQTKDDYLSGFQGFVTGEEMHAVARIALNPQRYQFTSRHPQRTYESMISLMAKYPWSYTGLYTLSERDRIFKVTRDQIAALVEHLKRHGSAAPLDLPLLHELLHAGLKCQGFSEKQRAMLIDASDGLVGVRDYVTPVAKEWPFETIGAKENLGADVILYVLELLYASKHAMIAAHIQQSLQPIPTMTLAQISRQQMHGPATPHAHHGAGPQAQSQAFKIEYPKDKENLTMAQVAEIEWSAIEQALRNSVREA